MGKAYPQRRKERVVNHARLVAEQDAVDVHSLGAQHRIQRARAVRTRRVVINRIRRSTSASERQTVGLYTISSLAIACTASLRMQRQQRGSISQQASNGEQASEGLNAPLARDGEILDGLLQQWRLAHLLMHEHQDQDRG